jgi:histidine triad (HIT) family protein
MRSDTDCIFCNIVAGVRPCHKVLETDQVLAIMDIYPSSDGHTLVMPKDHFESIFDISESAMQAVALAARRIAGAIRAELAPDGMVVSQLNGAAAGQTVMHYHVHVVPRSEGARRRLHGERGADPSRLAKLARAIAARL